MRGTATATTGCIVALALGVAPAVAVEPSPGDVDTTFGTGGRVITPMGPPDIAQGRLLTAGAAHFDAGGGSFPIGFLATRLHVRAVVTLFDAAGDGTTRSFTLTIRAARR
jgi:hypothetical protein